MATILLRVSVRDHDSGGGGYFYPYGDRSVGWRRSIESEGKRIENLNAETITVCNQVSNKAHC